MLDPTIPKTRLRREREGLGLSRPALARLTIDTGKPVHPQTIALAEQSGRVTLRLARRLAPILGCSPEELVAPRHFDR